MTTKFGRAGGDRDAVGDCDFDAICGSGDFDTVCLSGEFDAVCGVGEFEAVCGSGDFDTVCLSGEFDAVCGVGDLDADGNRDWWGDFDAALAACDAACSACGVPSGSKDPDAKGASGCNVLESVVEYVWAEGVRVLETPPPLVTSSESGNGRRADVADVADTPSPTFVSTTRSAGCL